MNSCKININPNVQDFDRKLLWTWQFYNKNYIIEVNFDESYLPYQRVIEP